MSALFSLPLRAVLVLAGACVLMPDQLQAQDGFLFRAPVVTLGLRGGSSLPQADDDLHRFFTRQLTLDRRDFASFAIAAEAAVRLSERVDVVFDLAHAGASRSSEFRNWVGDDDLPIAQTTSLTRTPATVGFRVFPLKRGEQVGEHAWVPGTLAPYVGAAGGMMWYTLEQEGEFIEEPELVVFADRFYSTGSSVVGQVFAGAELWARSRFGLTVEARYSWARADLGADFRDFDRIDLSGLQLTAGLSTRF